MQVTDLIDKVVSVLSDVFVKTCKFAMLQYNGRRLKFAYNMVLTSLCMSGSTHIHLKPEVNPGYHFSNGVHLFFETFY